MGELHLEIIVDRMKREFGVEANVGKPQVAYRETIRKTVEEVEGKFVRQSGGKGQYGHVVLKIEPQEPGKGFEFVDAIKGGVVPREFIPAVKKGVEDTLPNGVLAGYPVVDVKVTLTFGSYHEVDSNENAFKMAASIGFKEGCRKASPVILEPMMAVEVETPEDYAGNVMGDLSSRRGMVQGMDDMPGGGKVIKAEVPLSEMFGYSTTLRSMSQGRATYTMEFKHYSEAPKNVADAIITSRGSQVTQQVAAGLRSAVAARCQWRGEPALPETLNHTLASLFIRRSENGKRQIRADQAARERGHDRSRGPWQDHADGGDHHGAVGQVRRRGQGLRPDRRGARRKGARHHHQHRPRRVRDGQPPLRARGLPRATPTTSRT